MYKLLLSWRYLLTRFLALASIISVMLGVATLVVVNSVMEGFATKLKDRLRGLQAHVVVESRSMDGFYDCTGKMRHIQELLGDRLEAISPVIESFAMMQYQVRQYDAHGRLIAQSPPITRPVRLMGIDPSSKSHTGEFGQFLQDPENRGNPAGCFDLKGDGAEHYHRVHSARLSYDPLALGMRAPPSAPTPLPKGEGRKTEEPPPTDAVEPPPELRKPFGAVVGYGIATYRKPDAKVGDAEKDVHVLHPGDEVTLTMVSRTELEGHDDRRGYPRPVVATFVITDDFKTEMSEIDSNVIYISLADMQRLRTMEDRATSLQIKLKDYERDKKAVKALLERHFHPMLYMVQTWEDKQGPLLAAISIDRGLLNILLFLIIAVAGFGILAIFFMIVVEKTRDIGILKALGASNAGVMGIFLTYGLALGLVGAGLGTLLGLTITININEIELFLAHLTGQEVFDKKVYYFDRIPTDIRLVTLAFVNAGAVLIAVSASVFPALRAALLHPVQALRYE